MGRQPARADETAYGFRMFVVTLAAALCEILALAMGEAGALRWRRKRTLLGVACSVLFSAVIHDQAGLGRLISLAKAFFTEIPPKLHTVSP